MWLLYASMEKAIRKGSSLSISIATGATRNLREVYSCQSPVYSLAHNLPSTRRSHTTRGEEVPAAAPILRGTLLSAGESKIVFDGDGDSDSDSDMIFDVDDGIGANVEFGEEVLPGADVVQVLLEI
jgi:hypothetical protein